LLEFNHTEIQRFDGVGWRLEQTMMSPPQLVATLALLAVLLPTTKALSYNNDWAAECPGGIENAREVAEHTGCSLESEIIPDSNIYQFRCHHVRRRSTEPDTQAHASLEDHEHISWATQQQVKSRRGRQGYWPGMGQMGQMGQMGGMGGGGRMGSPWARPRPRQQDVLTSDAPYENPLNLNDQRWPLMWYLNRGDKLDMNVQEAWQSGITGKGIVITILDDGVERANPDLIDNYDPKASFDVNDNDGDPNPRYDLVDSNRHGTRCAGEVSASANNSVCGVGIAYNSKIGGVRMLDGDVTDAVEARSISLNNQHIDIYSASWGPDDDGRTVDGPGNLAKRAFINGIQNGRGGKGSIFVWASGNGGREHDNCNCDGYTNSIWTLSVSSATENGLIPWYSEACSSTMATTYSSGSSGERKIVTTDLHNLCTSGHTGTSASAPMAAGVIALVLEAKPDLTWRDVQHITVRNCHVANLRATDWNTNAMGRNFSHSFGYGIMDASGMVRTARSWKNVPEQKSSAVNADIGVVVIPASSSRSAKMEVTDSGDVNFLEHVQAHITLTAARRGDVQLFLTSPGGTKSQLLARRPHDSSRAGFQDWPFLTVFSWGENPVGSWQLEIQNDGHYQVELHAWSLTFHGTSTDPNPVTSAPPTQPPTPSPAPPARQPAPLPAQQQPAAAVQQPAQQPSEPAFVDPVPALPELGSPAPQTMLPSIPNCLVQGTANLCSGCKPGYLVLAGKCVSSCPSEGYYQGLSNLSAHCLQCYYTCRTCSGGGEAQCTSCFVDAELEEGATEAGRCHNKNLIFKVFSSSRWYYILTLGFLVNTVLIILLVLYIVRRRARAKGSMYRGGMLDRIISPQGKGYSPVSADMSSKIPVGGVKMFRDDESEEEEEVSRGFMTPYSDNPKDKPYRDDERA